MINTTQSTTYNLTLTEYEFNTLHELLDENSRAECLLKADWAGGYLYLR